MNAFFSQVVSFFVGVGGSYCVWWASVHLWTPKVAFSVELAEYVLESGDSFFQCAFENVGTRDIIDLEIQVRFGIKNHLGATGWAHHSVKTNASSVPVLSPKNLRRVRVFDSRESIEFVDRPSKTLREAVEKCSSLRDILDLGTDATVRIHIFGYDAFSGVRKHYSSNLYRLRDIRKGTYKGLDVVQNTQAIANATTELH